MRHTVVTYTLAPSTATPRAWANAALAKAGHLYGSGAAVERCVSRWTSTCVLDAQFFKLSTYEFTLGVEQARNKLGAPPAAIASLLGPLKVHLQNLQVAAHNVGNACGQTTTSEPCMQAGGSYGLVWAEVKDDLRYLRRQAGR